MSHRRRKHFYYDASCRMLEERIDDAWDGANNTFAFDEIVQRICGVIRERVRCSPYGVAQNHPNADLNGGGVGRAACPA